MVTTFSLGTLLPLGDRVTEVSTFCQPPAPTHLLRALPIPRADPDLPVESSAERLLASFGRHLLNERALAESTTTAYLLRARRFLAWTAADGNVTALRTGDVTRAVLRESQSVSIGSAQFFVAAVRSFLRFCFVEGLIPMDLAPAALAVTGRRRSTLPRGISPKDARALLRARDRRQWNEGFPARRVDPRGRSTRTN